MLTRFEQTGKKTPLSSNLITVTGVPRERAYFGGGNAGPFAGAKFKDVSEYPSPRGLVSGLDKFRKVRFVINGRSRDCCSLLADYTGGNSSH
jgi:hypothetical protein